MACSELFIRKSAALVNTDRFWLLHPEGKKLIRGWFERAWEAKDCSPELSFEPFVFAWIAFNGWASCVTGLDQDRAYLEALMRSDEVANLFDDLLTRSDTPFALAATQFSTLWPIFDVAALRRKGIGPWFAQNVNWERSPDEARKIAVDSYLAKGALHYQPQCWLRHRNCNESIPVDFSHTLAAIYRVRCNLFHGQKAAHSEMDRLIVSTALKTLLHFMDASGYLKGP